MCGIAGVLSFASLTAGSREFASSALAKISHRGPDGENTSEGDFFALAHRRLSIIDLSSAAAQPMESPDQRWLLSYNGEVYNYRAIASCLPSCPLKSDGDTAVVLRACMELGVKEACVSFNGMFAFALIDQRSQRLWLARDRHGIKPLYYRAENGSVEFASELKCFGRASREGTLPEAATIFAMLSGAPHLGPESPWAGVREVPPGRVIEFSADSPRGTCVPYFEMQRLVSEARYREISALSAADYDTQFATLFRQAVSAHLTSDAPVGIGLSGGLDSASILAATRDLGEETSAFHADVTGHESEREQATFTASHFNTPLAVATMTREDFAHLLPETTWFNDYPMAYHPNGIPFAMMARRAAQEVKVLLTGEGADELLGGYEWVFDSLRQEKWSKKINFLARGIRRLGLDATAYRITNFGKASGDGDDFARLRELWNGHQSTRWKSAASAAYDFLPTSAERTFAEGFFVTTQGHLQSLLWRNDRMGMLAGIESRFPFLDNALVEFLVNTPMHHKARGTERKSPLRSAARKLDLPKRIANRPKFAFSANPSHFCQVDARFFNDGFLAHYLPDIAQIRAKSDWDNFHFYLTATEVWGRLFVQGQTPDTVRESLLQHLGKS